MTHPQQQLDDGRADRPDFGVLVAMGISLGAGVGAAFGNVGLGSALGLLLATLANAYYEWKQERKMARVSLALGLIALLLTFLILWLHRGTA